MRKKLKELVHLPYVLIKYTLAYVYGSHEY